MSNKKIYKKLPAVLHTTAIKNFFENTVEQLFSKAETDNIRGYIGAQRSEDFNALGSYLSEPTGTKRFYGLSPTINNINSITGESENLIFYDELIDILTTYGVNTKDHNKLFGENYATFMPPINADKLLNYAEYYWHPVGPTPIDVAGTLADPIDITVDIIGQKEFTPVNGIPFRNGMVVRFVGEYVIPETQLEIDYIVEGVGTSIMLLPKQDNFNTKYTVVTELPYDPDIFSIYNPGVRHSAGSITSLDVLDYGIGYVEPVVLIYDEVMTNDTPALVPGFNGSVKEYIEQAGRTLTDLDDILTKISSVRTGSLATTSIEMSPLSGMITSVNLTSAGSDYSGEISVTVFDKEIARDIDTTDMTSGETIVIDRFVVTADTNDVKPGQRVRGVINGKVASVSRRDDVYGVQPTVFLEDPVRVAVDSITADPTVYFEGVDFMATALSAEMQLVAPAQVDIFNTQAKVAINPNVPTDYYLLGGDNGWDQDDDGDGFGDRGFAGFTVNATHDYLVQERGAFNRNVWSRVNFWYHRDNFLDAGDPLPSREFRADRPILEFDRELELYNHAESSIGAVTAAVTEYTFDDVDGQKSGFVSDNVPLETSTFIFVNELPDIAKHIWTATSVIGEIQIDIDDIQGYGASLRVIMDEDIVTVDEFGNTITQTVKRSGRDAGIVRVEVLNGGQDYVDPTLTVQSLFGKDATVEATVVGGVITEVNVTNPGTGYYDHGTIRVYRIADPILNPLGAEDGDNNFVPFEMTTNQAVQISSGTFNVGREYIWTGLTWSLAQEKLLANQAPLFNLYDVNGALITEGFAGNKLFGFAEEVPADSTNITKSTTDDPVLGYPLVYRHFNASSEILFENFMNTASYNGVNGHVYYKLLKDEAEYHNYWKIVDEKSTQRIVTTYEVNQFHADAGYREFFIGGYPAITETGYDITVKVNNIARTDYTYTGSASIEFDSATFNPGDFVEISIIAPAGLISQSSDNRSQFELPLSWDHNPLNNNIDYTSEPEFLPHLKGFIERQRDFAGDSLSSNNHNSSAKDPQFATDVIQTNQDIILGAFLIDDQPHNLVDALRFNSQEYSKYKNRVKSEINKFYNNYDAANILPEERLEQVLRNVVSYKVGRNVFNRTYVLPFGDTYETNHYFVALNQTTFVTDYSLDLSKVENSILVYHENELLTIDSDYTITSYDPITIELTETRDPATELTIRVYSEERDSAQCPPTPSTMGLYPLTVPSIEIDYSYQTPLEVLVGHDGSRTPTNGDLRDQILLDFEKRIYNAAKKEFRSANSLPEYNISTVRSGAFRDTSYSYTEWHDLLRHHYALWTNVNELDDITNEFYDASNEWTWNYGSADLPGHWKGIYEYLYDTVRPHTHPWEMLGFTEKPLWWDSEYTMYTEDDVGTPIPYVTYDSTNTRMWGDLEQGIIRDGARENYTDSLYLVNNNYRRLGLHNVLPVDENGELITPYNLVTTGTTLIERMWVNTSTGNSAGYYTDSFLNNDGVTVSYDADYVYVQSKGIANHELDSLVLNYDNHIELNGDINFKDLSYKLPLRNNTSSHTSLNTLLAGDNPSDMVVGKAVAVLSNGLPLYNINYDNKYNNTEWTYNQVNLEGDIRQGHAEVTDGVVHYHTVSPKAVGLEDWNTDEHSPIVGWAFDGLPIYGPYGYADPMDSNSGITRVLSPWELREDLRETYPGGAHTGTFIEDYTYNNLVGGTGAYTNHYNVRYGFTPESPTIAIYYYVVTVDENHEPVFPYHVGGGINTDRIWQGQYFAQATPMLGLDEIQITDRGGLYTTATVIITGDGVGATATATVEDGKIADITLTSAGYGYTYAAVTITGDGVRAKAEAVLSTTDNSTSTGELPTGSETVVFSSVYDTHKEYTDAIANNWKFGDSSPVEQAWKATEGYPFAVAEALLLAKPGRFATIFADPTKLYRPAIDKRQLLCTVTNERWQFNDADQFEVHGDADSNDNFITNIGYTQFISSWLTFQGLDMVTDFVEKMRSLNMKLAHRMSGYVDKDTMTVRTDRFSSSGNATSLIVPQENIAVTPHVSAYKSRNYYTGVKIEKTGTGYKVYGFDKTRGYFVTTESDIRGRRERVTIGGNPAAFTVWQPNSTYRKGTIVQYQYKYYQAPINLTTGDVFDRTLWLSMPSLPMEGGATATLYQNVTSAQVRVTYGTEYETVDGLFDFLINLGRFQTGLGFDFGEYDSGIAAVKDWFYAAKQFLLWTTGKWEIGNTLELSPAAGRVIFDAPNGFVSQITRTDRDQFSIIGQSGELIDPTLCEIIREDNRIEVLPPAGQQIYGIKMYVKEMEHAMVFDNLTEFNDVIYDPTLNQRHKRLKVKGIRTANWDGRFSSHGFIIDGDELLPNLDNMAESLGRYHELGFIPVEKQIYEASRALFGYSERDYLRELDVLDDEQFDFYKGLIQNKGTSESISRIGRSSAVVDGTVTVYDEWALKAGDFGDVDKNQTVELKIAKSELVQDPQLIVTGLPETVTNVIRAVDVIESRYQYDVAPVIAISAPALGGTQATAEAILDADGYLRRIDVIEQGSGYNENAIARVVAGDVVVDNATTTFGPGVLQAAFPFNTDSLYLTVEFGIIDHNASEDEHVVTVTGSPVTAQQIVTAINDLGLDLTASIVNDEGDLHLRLVGSDYTIREITGTLGFVYDDIITKTSHVNTEQRYAIDITNINGLTTINSENIVITVDGINQPQYDSNGVKQWSFNNKRIDDITPIGTYATDATIGLITPISVNDLTVDNEGQYKFVELYINGYKILNSRTLPAASVVDPLDDPGIKYIIDSNTNTINFPDISRIPRYALNVINSAVTDPEYTIIVQPTDADLTTTSEEYALSSSGAELLALMTGNVESGYWWAEHITTSTSDFSTTLPTVNNRLPYDITLGDSILIQSIRDEFSEGVEEYYIHTSSTETGDAEYSYKIALADAPLQSFGITPETEIRVVKSATIVFTPEFTNDTRNSVLNIRVLAHEGIAVRTQTVRNYYNEEDRKDDDVIFIDIDDADRFVKKPLGQLNESLWSVNGNVSYRGIVDPGYTYVPNAGYVSSKNVNYQAFGLNSLPDLFAEDIIKKPTAGDTIHVAKGEMDDWNVYKLRNIAADTNFLYRTDEGAVNLVTNYSLFNYLDTNQIGERNTGKFLDYFLSLENSNISDRVVVWNNEEIIQAKQFELRDFKAPRMIEARISKIKPFNLTAIQSIEPSESKRYSGAKLTPLTGDFVEVSGNNFTSFAPGDVIRLVDSRGTLVEEPATVVTTMISSAYGEVTVTASTTDKLQLAVDIEGLSNVSVFLTGSINTDLEVKPVAELTDAEKATLAACYRVLKREQQLVSINNSTSTFVVDIPEFADANVRSNVTLNGYAFTSRVDYGTTEYTIFDTTATSFKIERPNTPITDRVDVLHLNNSRLELGAHQYQVGDVIRVFTDTINGMYRVTGTTDSGVIIPAPYIAGFTSGDILQEGLEIFTTTPHGISPLYAQNGKQIAVHFAEPLYYNKVYSVSQVRPNSLVIGGMWAMDRRTHTFYEERSGKLSAKELYTGSNPATATNIIPVTTDVTLDDYIAMYDSSNKPVPKKGIRFLTVEESGVKRTYAVFAPSVLPTDVDVRTGIRITRQRRRHSDRYPVLTTLDHTKVNLKGSIIDIDSYNNPAAVAESINRAIELRKQFVKPSNDGKLRLSFTMVNDPGKVKVDGVHTANEISDYGPYLRDPDLINRLSDGQLTQTGTFSTATNVEAVQDSNFNQGSIKVGPMKGLYYLDSDTGVGYYWDSVTDSYIPASASNLAVEVQPAVEYSLPEYDVQDRVKVINAIPEWVATTADEINASANPDTTVVYLRGSVVVQAGNYYQAEKEITMSNNVSFAVYDLDTELQWLLIANPLSALEAYNDSLVLSRVPGTGSTTNWTAPGQRLMNYAMEQTVTFDSVTIPKYRLLNNQYNMFMVYEAVQNDLGDIFYMLVDKSTPPTVSHDFVGTVNKYNDFGSYPRYDYYYDNEITPSVNGSNQITNSQDPARKENVRDVIVLPAVEPAATIGNQLIAEPFAIPFDSADANSGNRTDAIMNIQSLPEMMIESSDPAGTANISIAEEGYDQFLLWAAGTTPGELYPTAKGPGKLAGPYNQPVGLGYGTGYYAPNDDHLTGEYPVTGLLDWDKPLPRLMYNAKFSVYPAQSTKATYRYYTVTGTEVDYRSAMVLRENGQEITVEKSDPVFVDLTDENNLNTGIRPEEIFVACFWTESFTYKNQLTSWDYSKLDAKGLPTPVYSDYNGTVVRVKYIRITELPANAVTRRLIPDTGWAGKPWNNQTVDSIVFSDDDTGMWDQFVQTTENTGSSADDAETATTPAITVDQPTGTGVNVNESGLLSNLDTADFVPVTEAGPILNAAVLNGLPGPCEPAPTVLTKPGTTPTAGTGATCVDLPFEKTDRYLNNTFDEFKPINDSMGVINFKVVRNELFRVVFDNRKRQRNIGIIIVQSKEGNYNPSWSASERLAYFEKARIVRDTLQTGEAAYNNGDQIGSYGFDANIDGSQYSNTTVNELLDITVSDLVSADRIVTDVADLEAGVTTPSVLNPQDLTGYYNEQDWIGVRGLGFLQSTINCVNGEYVDVFVLHDTAAPSVGLKSSTVWEMVVTSTVERVEDETPSLDLCDNEYTGSRRYYQGAVYSEWRGDTSIDSVLGRNGYFGQHESNAETWSELVDPNKRYVDNIYYPYQALPADYNIARWNPDENGNTIAYDPNRWADEDNEALIKMEERIVSSIAGKQTMAPYSTVEIKGYFRAPFTGTYTFNGYSSGSLWMWISSEPTDTMVSAYPGAQWLTDNNVYAGILNGYNRKGVDDLDSEEWFKNDGYLPDDEKNYTRENAILHTGRKSMNMTSKYVSPVKVELEKDKYYFVRIIAGNWSTTGGYFETGYTVGSNSGVVRFSGRECYLDEAPAPTVADQQAGTTVTEPVEIDTSGATIPPAETYEATPPPPTPPVEPPVVNYVTPTVSLVEDLYPVATPQPSYDEYVVEDIAVSSGTVAVDLSLLGSGAWNKPYWNPAIKLR